MRDESAAHTDNPVEDSESVRKQRQAYPAEIRPLQLAACVGPTTPIILRQLLGWADKTKDSQALLH